MEKRRYRKVTDKEKAVILSKKEKEGKSASRIAAELDRSVGVVRRVLDEKAIVLTNKTLQQINTNPLSLGVGQLIDILAAELPDTEIEEIVVKPRERSCRVRFYRDITFTV